jgi:hypothetical protein
VTLEELNELHGTRFVSNGAYAGGEFGAQRVIDEFGRTFVLKWQPPGLAPETTKALREVGYPAPGYVVVGETYAVQEELPGEPLGGWGLTSDPELIRLNEIQTGRAVDGDRSWPEKVVDSVLTGGDEYMVLANLTAHSDEGRELLARCQAAVEQHADSLETTDDIVHWDFTGANVLVEAGAVSGVIDWGGTCSGDRLFDLATYLYYCRGNAPELARYLVERIGQEGVSVYLAHMAVRQAEWSISHHPPGAGWEMVQYGLELAREFPK